jgi:hypothetical protein
MKRTTALIIDEVVIVAGITRSFVNIHVIFFGAFDATAPRNCSVRRFLRSLKRPSFSSTLCTRLDSDLSTTK